MKKSDEKKEIIMNYLNNSPFIRYERNIGVHSLRKWLLNQVWRNYQEAIPRILKHLRGRKQQSDRRLEEIQAQINGLDSLNLRSVASNYVVNFLQIIEQLLLV